MRIQLHEISIREVAEGYSDNGHAGVCGYAGRLDIRPLNQGEFVYNEPRRNAASVPRCFMVGRQPCPCVVIHQR